MGRPWTGTPPQTPRPPPQPADEEQHSLVFVTIHHTGAHSSSASLSSTASSFEACSSGERPLHKRLPLHDFFVASSTERQAQASGRPSTAGEPRTAGTLGGHSRMCCSPDMRQPWSHQGTHTLSTPTPQPLTSFLHLAISTSRVSEMSCSASMFRRWRGTCDGRGTGRKSWESRGVRPPKVRIADQPSQRTGPAQQVHTTGWGVSITCNWLGCMRRAAGGSPGSAGAQCSSRRWGRWSGTQPRAAWCTQPAVEGMNGSKTMDGKSGKHASCAVSQRCVQGGGRARCLLPTPAGCPTASPARRHALGQRTWITGSSCVSESKS